jgi:hypothetical protein
VRPLAVVLLVLTCSACTSASSGPRSTVIWYPEGLPGDDEVVQPAAPPDVYVYRPPIVVPPLDGASADADVTPDASAADAGGAYLEAAAADALDGRLNFPTDAAGE